MPLEPTTRLVREMQHTGRKRIPLDQLRAVFARACPELAEQPDRRAHLAQLLERAKEEGAIEFPRGSQRWDRTGAALPAFVVLAMPRVTRRAVASVGCAWHPMLAFAAHERNPQRLQILAFINEWLKNDPNRALVVPIKERSLEIFGDEKRLDRLRDGLHLFDGQLTLVDLGCRLCPIPLPYEAGPEISRGRPILIVENNDTWSSFCLWNRRAGRFSAVAYAGGGNAKGLAYDETFLDELLQRHEASELLYFGDLDPGGLRIAAGAARRRAARGGMALLPAVGLYDWILVHGRRTRLSPRKNVTAEELDWLPLGLRSRVEQLFAAGERIPQEALGTRALCLGAVAP